ncbi:DUF6000 family protein [Streptomyces sp. TLI_146]|uniref:DUF6000 family protein n=1 Tax=Streptomyces sp. TLI_146 TaxID=1938858 RepID=UPI000C7112E5|nr:DUF6000 family protein [Streptomyces sp. TLI_146]PKV82653.1 hypothetical protein BX283_0094 [Streptomyces sp. TLI_146]
MRSQHPDKTGHGYVIERYVMRMDSDAPRYLELNGARALRPGWPHAERFARHMIEDAVSITDEELEALLAYEWRSRLTGAWLIGVGRRESFRERIAGLLLASEVCYSGAGYCFALARFATREDSEILTAYLDHYLARTDLHYDQGAALGALLHLDARLATHYADRFTQPDGPWNQWVEGVGRLGYPSHTPAELRRWTDLQCGFANGWSHV